jgi:hypothetical protein
MSLVKRTLSRRLIETSISLAMGLTDATCGGASSPTVVKFQTTSTATGRPSRSRAPVVMVPV